MNKIIAGIVLLLAVGGAYYFIAKNTTTPAAPVPSVSAPTSVAVSIRNFSFNPSTLTVTAGTKVIWTNADAVVHTVTSDSGDLFNSPTLAPGQSFSFIFATPGVVSYHCAIHPMMKGTINVGNK